MASPQHWTWDTEDEEDIVETKRDLERLRYMRKTPGVLAQIAVCERALERMNALKAELVRRAA